MVTWQSSGSQSEGWGHIVEHSNEFQLQYFLHLCQWENCSFIAIFFSVFYKNKCSQDNTVQLKFLKLQQLTFSLQGALGCLDGSSLPKRMVRQSLITTECTVIPKNSKPNTEINLLMNFNDQRNEDKKKVLGLNQ